MPVDELIAPFGALELDEYDTKTVTFTWFRPRLSTIKTGRAIFIDRNSNYVIFNMPRSNFSSSRYLPTHY